MPLYIMYGQDKPGALELRKATRPAHLDWIRAQGDAVQIGGPIHNEDGGPPAGSTIIIEANSLEAAKAIFAQDPYTLAGLWASQDVRPFTWVKL